MGRFVDIDRLFRLYYRPLCLYATHYLKDPDAVEDIVQDAFEALWEKMAVSDIQSPKSYSILTFRRLMSSYMRRRLSMMFLLSFHHTMDASLKPMPRESFLPRPSPMKISTSLSL